MSDWEVRISTRHGYPYFFNNQTQESSWKPPPELSQDEINALPGAENLKNPSPPSAEQQVRASHLLVKHSGSRRPSSWKEEKITRSKDDAIKILEGYRDEINGSSTKFAELAGKHSDCSSHAKGGDLGLFGKGQMQKPFEEATYALEIGEISDIISTDSGVHIILRTA